MNDDQSRFPHKLLMGGIAAIVIGLALLLKTTGVISTVGRLWPTVILLVGLYYLYRVFAQNGKEENLFVGLILSLLGTFFLLWNSSFLSAVTVERIWPLFMTIVGVSLFAYGNKKKKRSSRISLTVPGGSLFVFSILLLPFSFGIIPVGFREFVLTWWPILILGLGIVLVFTHLQASKKDSE